MNPIFLPLAVALSVSVSGLATPAHAAAGHGYEFGAPGKPASATRSIEVNLADNYYEPDAISVKQGETVRFVLKNSSEFLHEFSIGTLAAHTEHRKEMAEMMEMGMLTRTGINPERMNMDHSKMDMSGMSHANKGKDMPMRHDDPNTVLLAPGENKELVWKFTKAMEIEFACNMPGHYESGMLGRIDFSK
ncbi:MAG: hypothetical protein Dbin4_02286 [Alphaproteobacteria bacterium]|nr:hypothetical protein [Alphaproteobacteria bacterium]